MADLPGFEGKLALVTGAGDGIGKMLAHGFAAAGMRVCVQDIRAEAAEAVAGEIGDAAFPLVFDVSDRDATFAAADELGGPINILWLNAGVGIGATLLGGSQRSVEWTFGVNVFGVIWCAQAFRPLMTEEPRHVGVTASSAALRPPEGDFKLYATSKHATFAVAEGLRGELAAEDISTTILCPGLLNTEIWNSGKARPERYGGAREMDPSISTIWREAPTPEAMWPHIATSIRDGGGYLACVTDTATRDAFTERAAAIERGITKI